MKSLKIEPYPNSGLVKVAYEGGGEVPDQLKGAFTSPAAAKAAIEVWKANENKAEVEVKVTREEEEKAAKARYQDKK